MSQPRFRLPNKTESREQHLSAYAECWSCQQPSNAHCGPGEPRSGEVSICLNCTDPSIFTEGGGLRQPSAEEHAAIIAEPEYRTLAEVIRKANRQAFSQQADEQLERWQAEKAK